MTAMVIDGRALAGKHRAGIPARVERLRRGGVSPALDAILVDAGDNAARVYADNQRRTCEELGIEYRLHVLEPDSRFDEIAGRVLLLNQREDVSAIMVHLPLPEGVDAYRVQRLIEPGKDIEGVNPANIGNVVYGREGYAPCTAVAAMRLIESTGVDLRGAMAVVVGAGNVVGKPIAVLLMRQEATVVSCNEHTRGLEGLTREAEVLVAAAGSAELVRGSMVRPGAVVVDVGVNRVEGTDGKRRTVGDVAFEEVKEVAGWISPVPGGVGPMTVAVLLGNVVRSAERRQPGAGG
ncbi:MAG: bifunctional 5,10-methylenetetrahydrofolate dehydrogenase/5,10-methenyltetrahydrofolate cyclohydrolase [Phycisphaeraceae bacterium]|nr:bifunctional 5,10-methylenetetrahydrofolate dehydrogenase/5,10-methenyltetrahydrofolate cyclohydrolase [Phycisphaeraceae bacterium]